MSTGLPELLPAPDATAQAHSAALQAAICAEVAEASGWLSFARYMELALYAPGRGYYSAGAHKLGPPGDFVTAPEVSPLYARCLARQCAEVLDDLRGGDILELGAGSGIMAADLLAELQVLNSLPGRYLVLELSAGLRQRQQQTLRHRIPALASRVQWLDGLPVRPITGLVLANEVLDAMPVHRFELGTEGPLELGVWCVEGRLDWLAAPAAEPLRGALERLKRSLDLPPGYRSELNLALRPWIAAIANALERGLVLLTDYGFPRAEYYHPQRSDGTLMCHYRHRSHADPLILCGLQDITAHVDFSAVAQSARAAGLTLAGYTSQAHFLVGCGLEDVVGAALAVADRREQMHLLQQVKRLTLPSEMGELFKALALGRGLQRPLRGFAHYDRRHTL